ncbi:MAG: glycosyltransferase family 39 protein [candidate division NC10 bacterium]|nr:glycosyltransferase family 39 protein [candidate division NC10 bacterium]
MADILLFLSAGLLAIALTGRFPFSGVYSSPFGVIRIGPKPTIWVALFVLSALARITLRQEGGRISGLATHPTPVRLFLISLFMYNANGAQHGAVDTIATRFLPYSILKEGDFDLDEFRFLYAHGIPGYLIQSGGHLVSAYPPGPAILALPFFLLPVLGGVPPDFRLLTDVEKLAAAVITALSVALIFQIIRMLEGLKAALILSLIYAFATSSFSISSQALWQHGPSQLLLAASLYFLVRGLEKPGWVAFSGFTLGWAVLCRPTDLFIAIPLALYVLCEHRDQAVRFILLVLPSIIVMAIYNFRYFGSISRIDYDMGFFSGNGWATPFWEELSGILISPSRGLFIYSPIFLFAPLGIFLAWRRMEPPLLKYLSVAVVLVVTVYSKWIMWWGGWTFGPRLLADITPLLTLLLIPAFRRIEQHLTIRNGFYVLAGISIAIHRLGAFFPSNWNPDVEGRLWSWSDGQLINSIRVPLSKVTGRYYPIDIPSMEIVIDKTSFRVGEEASITLTLHAGRNPVPSDAYLKFNGAHKG